MKVLLVILAVLAFIAGFVLDIWFMLIQGIQELVRGFVAHPMSGHDITFGLLRLVFSGTGIIAGIFLAIAFFALADAW